MLRQEDYLMIQLRRREGVLIQDIAQELGINRKTVSRTLKRGGAPPGTRCQRRSILDPYGGKLDELMASNVWNGKVMLRELQALGYPGSYTVMNNDVRPFRCARRCQSRATVRWYCPEKVDGLVKSQDFEF